MHWIAQVSTSVYGRLRMLPVLVLARLHLWANVAMRCVLQHAVMHVGDTVVIHRLLMLLAIITNRFFL
jgi:hypothetical protein